MARFRDLSLRTALILYVVVPLVVAIGTTSYIALRAFEQQVERRMEEDVELVAHAIRGPLSRALERGHMTSIEEAVESAFEIDRVFGTYVYNLEGEPIAAVGRSNVPNKTQLFARALGEPHGAYETVGNRAVYSYFLPLTNTDSEPIGLLQVTRRASDIHEYVITLRWEAVGFLLIAIGIMVGLVIFAHQGAIGRYLNRLTASMARVRKGNRSHRAALDGPREIAALGKALNTMLDSIEDAKQEIKQRQKSQVALEEQLKQAEKLAAIGQLSSGIAHELGTPLAVIDGKAQRALRKELSKPAAAALKDIRGEVRRVEHVIHQLLDFGQHDKVERRRISAHQLSSMAANALSEKSSRLKVMLTVQGPQPSPALFVDPPLMERALTNLIRNALEAAPGGEVKVSWFETEDHVGLSVDDNGPGIKKENKNRLFEPFFTTKNVGQGTGLGLPVVHGIVEEHSGHVEIKESHLGGACFRILLPPTDSASAKL